MCLSRQGHFEGFLMDGQVMKFAGPASLAVRTPSNPASGKSASEVTVLSPNFSVPHTSFYSHIVTTVLTIGSHSLPVD